MLSKHMLRVALVTTLLCSSVQVFAEARHGHSLYGEPKYSKDFKHLDYVNPDAPKGGEVVFAAASPTFDSLNPFVVQGIPAAGLTPLHPSLLHATLTASTADEPFSRYGYIAETIEIAPDRTWIIFNLRTDATFHDGAPIQAEDVIYTFNTLMKKGNPLYRSYYHDVKSVEKVGKHSVKFTFINAGNRELPLIIGEMPVLSKKFYEQHGFEKSDLTIPVGSGPYKIAKIKAGHSIVYERVKDWWGDKLPINKGRYNFDRIRYEYFRDDMVAFEAFKKGQIDFRLETTAKNWATAYDFPLFKQGKVIREEVKFENPEPLVGFIFNTRRPIFSDRRVRQAINYCFDFEWMNKNLFYGLYARTKSYFSGSELAAVGLPTESELKALEPYKDKVVPEVLTTAFELPVTDGSGNIRPQLAAAQKLLQTAGYEIKGGKMVNKATGQPLSFTIMLHSPHIERMANGFVANLKKLGIDVEIKIVDSAQYVARMSDYDFDMLYHGYAQSLSPGNEQRDFWHSSNAGVKGGRNYSGIKDPAIDAVIEKLVDAPSRDELITYTKALDRLLLWGYYTVIGYHSKGNRIAYSVRLKHPEKYPRYGFDFDTWWIDEADIKK
jgi:microcin C transport system substrate-binding protein